MAEIRSIQQCMRSAVVSQALLSQISGVYFTDKEYRDDYSKYKYAILEDAARADGPLLDFNTRDQTSGETLGMRCALLNSCTLHKQHFAWFNLVGKRKEAAIQAHEHVLLDAYNPQLLDALGNNLLSRMIASYWMLPNNRSCWWIQQLLARSTRPMDIDRPIRAAADSIHAYTDGMTPLLSQSARPTLQDEHVAGICFFIDHGANRNAQDKQGNLYIFHLVSNQKLSAIRTLLNTYGVDAYDAGHVNALGHTLCDVARSKGTPDLINLCEAAHRVFLTALDRVHKPALLDYLIPPLSDIALTFLGKK
jgi:hypothetical protein